MGGNKEGGSKAHTTLRERLGDDGYRKHMAGIGAKGGRVRVPKGLSFTRGKTAQELHEPRQQPSERQEAGDEDQNTS